MRRSDGMGCALLGGDLGAVLWAVACCWAAVWGNYLLLATGLEAAAIVPFDLFAVPALVSLAFRAVGRPRR